METYDPENHEVNVIEMRDEDNGVSSSCLVTADVSSFMRSSTEN